MSARCWLSDNLWWSQIKIGNKNTSETCETKDSSQPVWSGRVQRPVSNLCSCSESSIFLESHQGVWSACRTEECYKALSGPDSHGTSQGGIIRGGYMDSSLGENIRQQSLGKYPDIGLMMIWIGTNWFSSALVSQACQSSFALLLSPGKGTSFRFYLWFSGVFTQILYQQGVRIEIFVCYYGSWRCCLFLIGMLGRCFLPWG